MSPKIEYEDEVYGSPMIRTHTCNQKYELIEIQVHEFHAQLCKILLIVWMQKDLMFAFNGIFYGK